MNKSSLSWLLVSVAFVGCTVGPDYVKPTTETPAGFKETVPTGEWKVATPSDTLPRGAWWQVFGDPVLNQIQAEVAAQNQSLAAAVQRIEQARALRRATASGFYPTAQAGSSGTLGRSSSNSTTAFGNPNYSNVQITGSLNYELDLWGRVRRSVESAQADLQAREADFENVRLVLQAEAATVYFQLRSTDAERALLRRTVETRKQALDLVDRRFKGGVSNELDFTRARTELATTQSQRIALDRTRGELEHALAVLIGRPASTFQFPESPLTGLPPLIPAGLPSELLERRPDVASAERAMASANAQIGVAKAAFFPVFSIGGTGGYQSVNLGTMLDWPSRLWAVGASVSLPLFTAGRLEGNLDAKKAAYLESLANYKQTVLLAYKDVEDGLVGARILAEQSEAVAEAVASSRRSADISNVRYKDGLVNYLEVVDTERSALQTEQTAVQLLGQRYTNAVFLIRALGGGWPGQATAPVSGSVSSSYLLPQTPSSLGRLRVADAPAGNPAQPKP